MTNDLDDRLRVLVAAMLDEAPEPEALSGWRTSQRMSSREQFAKTRGRVWGPRRARFAAAMILVLAIGGAVILVTRSDGSSQSPRISPATLAPTPGPAATLPGVPGFNPIVSTVVGQHHRGRSRTMTISTGSSSGVAKGLAVVSVARGALVLVGRVASVTPKTATVIRLDDTRFRVGAEPNLTGDGGTVRGVVAGTSRMTLSFSPNMVTSPVTIRRGNSITTSVEEDVPPGLLIGSVSGPTQEISAAVSTVVVRPAATLATVRHVAVLAPSAP